MAFYWTPGVRALEMDLLGLIYLTQWLRASHENEKALSPFYHEKCFL